MKRMARLGDAWGMATIKNRNEDGKNGRHEATRGKWTKSHLRTLTSLKEEGYVKSGLDRDAGQ